MFEAYLRYVIFQVYFEYKTRILAITVPHLCQDFEVVLSFNSCSVEQVLRWLGTSLALRRRLNVLQNRSESGPRDVLHGSRV